MVSFLFYWLEDCYVLRDVERNALLSLVQIKFLKYTAKQDT